MKTTNFVIQEHHTPNGVHWDLMLRRADILWTWRLDTHPGEIRHPIPAERIFDHPLKFLTYEGPVQNNTGSVKIVDNGRLTIHRLESDTIECELNGRTLNGRFTLHLQTPPLWTFTPAEA